MSCLLTRSAVPRQITVPGFAGAFQGLDLMIVPLCQWKLGGPP